MAIAHTEDNKVTQMLIRKADSVAVDNFFLVKWALRSWHLSIPSNGYCMAISSFLIKIFILFCVYDMEGYVSCGTGVEETVQG